MSTEIKNIFKILIGVPVVIMACFFIFNLFAFGFSMFKVLGIYFVVMQTAIENNYITPEDKVILQNYMDNQETAMLTNIRFTDETEFNRVQYGTMVDVGVEAKYNFIMPLTVKEQTKSGGVEGFSDVSYVDSLGSSTIWKSADELEYDRQQKLSRAKSNIRFHNKIPGLKYYPDLE